MIFLFINELFVYNCDNKVANSIMKTEVKKFFSSLPHQSCPILRSKIRESIKLPKPIILVLWDLPTQQQCVFRRGQNLTPSFHIVLWTWVLFSLCWCKREVYQKLGDLHWKRYERECNKWIHLSQSSLLFLWLGHLVILMKL